MSLSLAECLASFKRRGRLAPLLREAALERLLKARAAEAGIAVTRAELQTAADSFRRQHGLDSAVATSAWLARNGFTTDDFEQNLECDVLADKLKDHLTRQRIPEHFAAHRDRYARARLRQIMVPSEGIARELLAQITNEGRDFAGLAREHSFDGPSRLAGGSIGTLARCQLAPAMAESVFAAHPGAVVGPLASQDGWRLFLVEELPAPELDGPTAAVIREELFNAWLSEQLRDLRVDLSCLNPS
jgi:parvulin-like peptidyl-prolyl isomerase